MLGIFAVIFIVLGLSTLIVGIFVKKGGTDSYGHPSSLKGGVLASGVMVTIFGLILFGSATITKVDAGEVLVPVQFGKVLAPMDEEGLSLISPFARRIRMPVRTVEISFISAANEEEGGLRSIQALSSEGAQVGVDVTVLYHVDPTKAGNVYRTVGTSWESTLVIPWTRNTVRDCIPKFSFEDARTGKRGEAAKCILDAMQTALAGRGIIIEDVLLRDMKADDQLQKAIDAKLEAQSSAQRALFQQREAIVRAETIVIEAEAQAEATVAIALGEAHANNLIAASLTKELLTLRVYEQLNDKTVIITSGGQSVLPILPIGDVSRMLSGGGG